MVRMALLFTFLITVTSHLVFGAEVEVSSIVNPIKVSINDTISMTVTVTGPDASEASKPIHKTVPEFMVEGPFGTSTNISIINGKSSVSKSYTYTLIPRKIGIFEVGGVTVSVGNQMFSASPTKVEVVAGSTSPTQPSPPSSQPDIRERDIWGEDNDIFITTSVDNKEPYVGEQITLTFELNYRLTLLRDTKYTPPSTTGFWTMELPSIPPSTKIINNIIFQNNTIKTALFPTTSGELTIGSASLTYNYGGFFSRPQSNTISTKPIRINVKPLPEVGKPSDFSGAVGNFVISANVVDNKVKVGNVVTIHVSVTGKGNLDILTSLHAPNFSAFKTYDPKVTETISNSGFVVGGAKTWEFVVIPKFQGAITLEPFSMSYFDPDDESYHTISTKPIDLTILPGDALAFNETTRDISRKMIENIATDIHYIKPDKTILKNARKQVYSYIYFYLLYVLPLPIFITALVVKRRRDSVERNTGLKRKLNAWKNAQKRIAEASQMIKSGMTQDFCGKLSESIVEYIGDRLNIDSGTLTTSRLEEIVKKNGITPDLAERIRKMLELCDFVRFSSVGSGQDVQEKLVTDTRDIINELKEVL